MTYDNENIFAKILRSELPKSKVFEDAEILAFHDISPQAPTHILVIPKGEYISFDDFTTNASDEVVGRFFSRVGKIAQDIGIAENGYRIIANTGNDGCQEVPHFHIHICAGKKLGRMLAD
ncbi:MAG: histidine triad nucleotide-binding protein [Rhodospirillaceae bacterium]|nr:histidine triad nucleotide-binding protein [Rhodospirillaceae bacterium]|tara:strand:+ start:6019 stop:6378 length:360 start_codon:yes stop_codon:yes gene_type:complete